MPTDFDVVPRLMTEVPSTASELVGCVTTPNEIPPSVNSLLNRCTETFLVKDYGPCIQLCKALLDFTWEKLNTGHWKDVHICWRHVYSLVSLLKGVSEVVIASHGAQSGCDSLGLEDAIRTFDMGLLMGAPVLDNILSKLSLHVHQWLRGTSYKAEQIPSSTDLESLDQPAVHNEVFKETTETASSDGLIHNSSYNDLLSSESKVDEMPKRLYQDNEKAEDVKRKRHKMNLDNLKVNKKKEIARVSCPSMEVFEREYLCEQRPVIITDTLGHWPALSNRRWSLEYLRQVAGYRTVPIEIGSKYTDDSWTQKLMTVNQFIDHYIKVDSSTEPQRVGYLAQHQLFSQIPELEHDIVVPDYCALPGTKSRHTTDKENCIVGDAMEFPELESADPTDSIGEDVDINAWFGPQGTISPLHHDPKENFLAQVVGQKYIRLYSEAMTPYLYAREGFMDNTSQVDVENPDHEKFPLYRNASYMDCVLKEGEMLFIPRKCWHYVRSLSVSFSVSFWWE